MLSSSKKKKTKLRLGTTTLLLLTWWFTSVTGTLINKKVMKQFPYPIAFTGLHLFIGAILDYIIISRDEKTNENSNKSIQYHIDRFKICAINGLFFSIGKYLTYLSYRQVPVSLTHTIKSMSPVFTVISQLIIFQHCVPYSELVTLIPIILGVTLSTINEIHFEMIGFLAAVSSTILGVAQNTTSKYILTSHKNKNKNINKVIISPMQLHMYGSLLSLCFLIPLSMYSEGADIYHKYMQYDSDSSYNVPYYYMMMSCCWLYGQTMASLFLLKRVTTVTHNVANTCKRFWIIVISIIYFKQQTTASNICGICLALTGFFAYQRMHKINNQKNLHKKLLKNLQNNSIQIHQFKHKNGMIHHRNVHDNEDEDEDDIELGENASLLIGNDNDNGNNDNIHNHKN